MINEKITALQSAVAAFVSASLKLKRINRAYRTQMERRTRARHDLVALMNAENPLIVRLSDGHYYVLDNRAGDRVEVIPVTMQEEYFAKPITYIEVMKEGDSTNGK